MSLLSARAPLNRVQPWPIIAAFLANLRDGWVGLDSGTGNGKYLPLPADRPGRVWTIGLDRSRNLLDIARTAGGTGAFREVVWGDVLGHSWREGIFVRQIILRDALSIRGRTMPFR